MRSGHDRIPCAGDTQVLGMIPEEMLPFSDDINGYDDILSKCDEKACHEQGKNG